jgi:hypothetical protein
MRGQIIAVALFLLVGIGMIVWIPRELALNDTCEPSSGLNSLRAQLHGRRVWSTQLASIYAELETIAEWPDARKQGAEDIADAQATLDRFLDSLYSSNPELGPRPVPSQADELRRQADEIDASTIRSVLESVMLERAAILLHCIPVVEGRAQ